MLIFFILLCIVISTTAILFGEILYSKSHALQHTVTNAKDRLEDIRNDALYGPESREPSIHKSVT